MIYKYLRTIEKINLKKIGFLFKNNENELLFKYLDFQSKRFSSSNDGDKINDENFESTSTGTEDKLNKNNNIQNLTLKDDLNKKFIEIDFFGPKDSRACLPGNVGFCLESLESFEDRRGKNVDKEFELIINHCNSSNTLTTTIERKLNQYETNQDRQTRVIENVAFNLKEEDSLEKNSSHFKSLFFVKIFQSSQLLKDDIKKLFPEQCLFNDEYTIITVFKNPFTIKKNIHYKQEFNKLAIIFRETLNKSGHWANFIDPKIKRSIFEDISKVLCSFDKRFNNYGVQLEQFGQCKFLSQINTTLFVGSIFTNAKSKSTELKKILNFLTEI